MIHRFLVGWDEPTPDRHEVKTVTRKGIVSGKTIREEVHYNATRPRQEIFDGECIPHEEIVPVEQASTYEEACELLDLPPELWEEGNLAEAVKNRSPYVHRVRLIYPGRTLAFYWWTPYKVESSPLPDCFSVDPPDIGAHSPPWIEGSARARGMLYLDGGNEKHSVFAISRVNTIEEAAEIGPPAMPPQAKPAGEKVTEDETGAMTMNEALLFKIMVECPKLTARLPAKRRKPPTHLEVFLAATKEGRKTPYAMTRKHPEWTRGTVRNRIADIEKDILNGQEKLSRLDCDDSAFRNVNAQLEEGRKHGARIRRRDLLDNTTGTEYEDE